MSDPLFEDYKAYYQFRAERYASKFDLPEKPITKADPWNWDSFTGK